MQKMRRTNAKVRKTLKEMGIYDITAFGHHRYSKDLFGLWDFIAKEKREGGFDIIFIQSKTGYATSKDREEMAKFSHESNSSCILAELTKRKIDGKPKNIVKITRWKDGVPELRTDYRKRR